MARGGEELARDLCRRPVYPNDAEHRRGEQQLTRIAALFDAQWTCAPQQSAQVSQQGCPAGRLTHGARGEPHGDGGAGYSEEHQDPDIIDAP